MDAATNAESEDVPMIERSVLQNSETVRRILMTQTGVLVDACRLVGELFRLEPRSLDLCREQFGLGLKWI